MDERDDYDVCNECMGYGNNYRYDPETDELICNCDDCLFNSIYDEDDWDD